MRDDHGHELQMVASQWGSQSWLQPAFSRPSAGHEGSLMTHEPPERRPQGGPQGKIARPTSISRKGGTDDRHSSSVKVVVVRRGTA